MEGIGTEVSQKIRAAIKAKLIELGAYVDDELPDYIMVMVANKRTKSQMDEDLQLFLSTNTKIFTSWLHTVLQKLQEVTVARFDGKKSKKKKSDEDEGECRSRKSSEEIVEKVKKHSKKHKESKKSKKNKHKSKDKLKSKLDKKEKDEIKDSLNSKNERSSSHEFFNNSERKVTDNSSKSKSLQITDVVGKAIIGDLKKNEKLKKDFLNSCSSNGSSDNSSLKDKEDNKVFCQSPEPVKINLSDNLYHSKTEDKSGEILRKTEKECIVDDFNIEPLKPIEKFSLSECQEKQFNDNLEIHDVECVQSEKTVSAPTEELLKEHNKLQNKEFKIEEKNIPASDSEESVSPEEMRKQLLLSRAKKKLENCKIADRMRSNSPDILILEDSNKLSNRNLCSPSRLSYSKSNDCRLKEQFSSDMDACSKKLRVSSPSRRKYSQSSTEEYRKLPSIEKTQSSKERETNSEEKKRLNSVKHGRNSSPPEQILKNKENNDGEEKRKTIIKISESLKMEKNLGIKKENDRSKVKQKDSTTKKRVISSRVITVTGPEAPEISSIVKVKPREFISKDKQANKALILKAVADAEKSIATVHTRTEIEPEVKKEALFTKNLREKRFEKLAVTLSNIKKGQDLRQGLDRRVSVGSEKSDPSRLKFNSSEISEGIRGKSDVASKKISKNDDQFISSKTNIMEKNDKYIRCWLEGVEKAVKDEEMVNPSEMEDIVIHSNVTDEENKSVDSNSLKNEKKRKRLNKEDVGTSKSSKNQKLSEKEIANLRVIPNSKSNDSGPQIVVTLDGLDSKRIKDIILRNKEAVNGPIVSTFGKKSSDKETKSKVLPKSPDKKQSSFEKISDRFARLNKTSEDSSFEKGKNEKNNVKYSDHERKEKSSTESKNRQLIAQLSEKFGKVDREFENKKRRLISDAKKSRRESSERNGKYNRFERNSVRDESPPAKFSSSSSSQVCKFYPNCKNLECRYFHPKRCRYDEDCDNLDCKYIHSEKSGKKKPKWYSKA